MDVVTLLVSTINRAPHVINRYFPYKIEPQAIGHSSNAPGPNLKKLIEPLSTAATTTVFLPALSTIKGFGFRSGTGFSWLNAQRNSRCHRDCSTFCLIAGGGGTFFGDPEELFSGGGRLCRGRGGGSSGRTSKRAVSSCIEGVGVVLALKWVAKVSIISGGELREARYFTTTREKSGGPGAVFLKDVDGL